MDSICFICEAENRITPITWRFAICNACAKKWGGGWNKKKWPLWMIEKNNEIIKWKMQDHRGYKQGREIPTLASDLDIYPGPSVFDQNWQEIADLKLDYGSDGFTPATDILADIGVI